jgi:hypothetical protein
MIDYLAGGLAFRPLKLTRNRIEHNVPPASPVDVPDRTGLKYSLSIRVPDFPGSNTYETMLTLPGREKPPVVQNGQLAYEGTFFRFESELDAILTRKKPDFGQKGLFIINSLTTPYVLQQRVTAPGYETSVQQDPAWAIKAGLLEEDFLTWGDRFFSNYQAANRPFLTWQPDNALIGGGQEEFLYYLMNFAPLPSLLQLRVQVTDLDGAETISTVTSVPDLQAYQVVGAAVGPAALDIDPATTLKYQVWLSDQNAQRISEVRTYWIDHRYQQQERYLLFNNSFHVFDTLRLVGKGSESLKVQRTVADRERPLNAPLDFSELYIVDRTGERGLTVSTGYFRTDGAETLRYLDELLLAEEWYLITDKGHQPLELITTEIVDAEDEPGLIARTFQFQYTAAQDNFSNLPVAPPIVPRPVYWFGVGLQLILDPYGKRTGYARPIKLEKRYADDNSQVIPFVVKPNVPGDPDYIPSVLVPDIAPGSTPYPSAEIRRVTTYIRNNCPPGKVGGPAEIFVPAGKYGGENPGDSDALARAEADSLNNQAFANQFGTCSLSGPQFYTVANPPAAGFYHLRTSAKNGATLNVYGGNGLSLNTVLGNVHGNTWYAQQYAGQPGNYIYPTYALDMDLPRATMFRFDYNAGSGDKTIKLYINGGVNPVLTQVVSGQGRWLPWNYDDWSTHVPDQALLYVEIA